MTIYRLRMEIRATNANRGINAVKDRQTPHLEPNVPPLGKSSNITFAKVDEAPSLWALNHVLTEAMANRSIQALVKGPNLDVVVQKVIALSATCPDDQLVAASLLGRLAAVVRGSRALLVCSHLPEIFTRKPADLDSLQDGDMKAHAAAALEHVDAPWCESYLRHQAVLIDTADNARRELLAIHLKRAGTLDKWINGIAEESTILRNLSRNARLRRTYRIFEGMHDVVRTWQGDVGNDVGKHLAFLMNQFLKKDIDFKLDESTLFETVDYCLSILVRAIELRFSLAFYARTYELLHAGVQVLGVNLWNRLLRASATIPRLRETLLEAILVLARQNRTDRDLAQIVIRAHTSLRQAKSAVSRRLKGASDLDPQVSAWWAGLGRAQIESRSVEQKVGRTEDDQIGILLIELEANRSAMERVARDIIPLLEISDPLSASTAKSATGKYTQIDQIARRLARLRKLDKMDLVGKMVEYNPLEHELVGGHRPGVRSVRVVRDGVLKDFGGRITTLVKPWVEEE